RFELFRSVTQATPLAPGSSLPGRVFESGKPVWIPDVSRDPNFLRKQNVGDLGVRAAFAFPVVIGTEVVAVLEFFSDRAIDPDQQLLEVMGLIGTQLGRVVE